MRNLVLTVSFFLVLPWGAFAADLYGTLEIKDGQGKVQPFCKDTVVFLEPKKKMEVELQPTTFSIVTQDKTFDPDVLPILKGSKVSFPNNDKILHNVFSVSRAKRFDLGLYRKGEGKTITFEESGLVNVYCNIHPNMVANILVLDYPYFTRVNSDCSYKIEGIPQGKYDAVSWYRYGEPSSREVEIADSQTKLNWSITHTKSTRKTHKNKHGRAYKKGY